MSRRRWLTAAGIGAVLATSTLLAALAVARTADSERRDRLQDAAVVAADAIVATIARDIVELERLAATATGAAEFRRTAQPRVGAVPEVAAVALTTRDGDRLEVATVVPADIGVLETGLDLASVRAFDPVFARTITEADAAAGMPFSVDGRELLTIAAPVLSSAAGPETERRSSVTGAVIGAVDVETLLGGRWEGAVEVVSPDGTSIGGSATGTALSTVREIQGQPWTIRFDAGDSGWPVGAWVVLVGGLGLTALLTGLFQFQVVRRLGAEAQARSRSLQLERIAEAGSRLQQSLDLAELLPAFAVSLAADFDLEAVAVSLIDSEGRLTEAFGAGDLAAGAAVELPLRRGWRSVGTLTVRPGRALDGAELTSLQALADLLAVAMSNAQLYEREQLSAARLRDLDALKNAFLGTVSHELRTSMTAIMGFGELLADSWENLDDDRRREMANRIRRSAGSLRHLVDDLLDFARLEQERLRVSPRAIDLAGIVRQTIDGLAPLLGQHELDMQLADQLPAWADPVAVERILANLVSNAAKYSPHGSRVTIAAQSAGDTARLVVADQGPGIPPEERRRIFARFYRLDTPESVRSRGAGIGLAILRDFADRSHAAVTVDDAPGGGARFTVDFPTQPFDVDGQATLAAAR